MKNLGHNHNHVRSMLYDLINRELLRNSTTIHSVMLAGSARDNGICQETQYFDPYSDPWNNVVVNFIVRILLKSFYVPSTFLLVTWKQGRLC